jgi:hypothetical protein
MTVNKPFLILHRGEAVPIQHGSCGGEFAISGQRDR